MKSLFTVLALTLLFFPFFSITVLAGGPPPGDSTHPSKQNIRLQDGLLVYFPLTYDEHGSPASAFGGNGYGGRVLVSNNGNMNFDSAFSVSFVGSLKRFGCQDFVSILENSTAMAFTFSLGTHIRGNNALVFDIADASSPCDNLPTNDHKATMISDFFRMYNRELNEAEVGELSKAFIGSTLPLHGDHGSSRDNTPWHEQPEIQLIEQPRIGTVSQEGIKDPGE